MAQTTKRAGWVIRGVRDPESVADHMYRMSVMALISAELPGVDRERLGSHRLFCSFPLTD